MAELRINTTGKLSLFDADDSHAASIVAGTVTANENVMSLATAGVTFNVPTITLGDATAEDTKLVFDGNAQDFHIGLDDSVDDLVIGVGSTLGTTTALAIDENAGSTFSGTVTVGVDDTGKDVKLFGATSGSYALWDESADDLNLIASGLGVTTAKDLGVGIHIRTADSGSAAASYADELVLENSTHCGLTICSSNSTTGNIYFGDGAGAAAYRGMITYDHNTDDMTFNTSAAEVFRIYDLIMATGDETAGDVSGGGLCLNQKATDANILTFKSSDVAHGITTNYETDTYAQFSKNDANSGGLDIFAFSERTDGEWMRLVCIGEGLSTTKSTSGGGAFFLSCSERNGTGAGALDADDNILTIADDGATRFIFDKEGDFHADNSSTTFDEYDDAQLVRTFDLSHGKGVIDSKFDKFIAYNHEKLADLKLVGREEDGTPNHFINVTGFQRVHNGAIWQQYEKHEKLLNAFYKLAEKTIGKDEATKLLEEEEIKLLN